MNYAGIARQIEIAASPYFFGLNQITLEIIGGILFLLGIFGFFIIEKHNKKIILLLIFLIITGLSIGTLGSYSVLSPKNFKEK